MTIVIFNKVNLSYREIPRNIKVDSDLKDLDGNVSKTRRIQKSQLMFAMTKSRFGQTDGFRNQVKNSLDVTVRAKIHEI